MYGNLGSQIKYVRPSVRPPAAFKECTNTLNMDSVIPPFWKNPPPDFGDFQDSSQLDLLNIILKVSACFLNVRVKS